MEDPEEQRPKEVSENQCQMCMPLGGVIAFKGIENAMVIVHGSQGCSTYMRLASVEHYNEPVDIASSSLNEKQTIFGGEQNLRKALDNVTRVYRPGVIGIVTTCLAETMGEDILRMLGTYRADREGRVPDIIPVPTPSYAGTQAEGFWAATRAIIAEYARPAKSHGGINVIVPHISPADIREIKRILDLMGIRYTLIPDYSLTLDRPWGGRYRKIPPGGTNITDIVRMPGATATIQFGTTCPDNLSPGLWLEQNHAVPLFNIPLPVGLGNTDRFLETLHTISGRTIPDTLVLERGWLCDAMADAHKINFEGRPVIYGEPELCLAFAGLCAENGAHPAVIACGTRNGNLVAGLDKILRDSDPVPVTINEADFAMIAGAATQAGANIAIGHSGGKFLTERLGIPVVRAGFPVHDRIGGQRILSAGYAGTLAFLDRFTNTLLEAKYSTYRGQIREEMLSRRGDIHAET